jgi:dTDP-6-deoxy-L-talose 4-dehydrogenase (NAD+)
VRLIVRDERRVNVEGVERVIITEDLFRESLEWMTDVCEGVDLVVHIAWYVNPATYLSSPNNLRCLEGTVRLAEAVRRSGVRRFVGVGTCFEYDLSAGVVSIDTPLYPNSLYGSAKVATFLTLKNFFALDTIEFLWCRLFYLYGDGEKSERLIPYLRSRLSAGQCAELTSGNQVRDFMDVAEAGGELARLAVSTRTGAVNVCSGVAKTVRELAEQIADDYNARDLLRFGVRQDNAVDPPCVVGVKTF